MPASVDLSNPQQQWEPGPFGDRAAVSINLLPFAMLALSAGLAFSVNGGSNGKLIAEAGVTAAAASWMVMILALRRSWEQRPWLGVALLAGLIALMAALVIINATFGFFTWTGYIWTFRLVQGEGWRERASPRRRPSVTGTSQHGGLPNSSARGSGRPARSTTRLPRGSWGSSPSSRPRPRLHVRTGSGSGIPTQPSSLHVRAWRRRGVPSRRSARSVQARPAAGRARRRRTDVV